MNLNKKIAKTLVFALTLGLLPFSGSNTVKAADEAVVPASIKFDGNKGIFNIEDASKAKFWGFAKELKDAKGANLLKVVSGQNKYYKVTEISPVVDALVDISGFYGKNVTLAFGNVNNLAPVKEGDVDNTFWAVKEVKAADKTFSIGYIAKLGDKFGKLTDTTTEENAINSDYGALVAYVLDKDTKAPKALPTTEEPKYEVRQGDGEWKAIKKGAAEPASKIYLFEDVAKTAKDKINPTFQMLTQNGSTLYFRLKADNANCVWPGDEKKVTFKKQPNAPKVVLDSSKDSSNIKSGMKVFLDNDTSTANDATEKTLPDGTKKATFKELGIDTIAKTKTGSLTIYTDAGKGKIQSKKTVLTLVRPDDITLTTGGDGTNKKLKESSGSYTAEGQEVAIIDKKLEFKLKVAYDITKGAVILNKDITTDYEYYVEHKAGANDGKVKWNRLKKAKNEKKPTVANIKYSESAKPFTFGAADSKIFVRAAGSKQNGTEIKLPSLHKEIKIGFTNIEQTLTATNIANVTKTDVENNLSELTIADVAKQKEHTYKIPLTMTGLQKAKSAKIKVTGKVPGVSVKAGKFTKEGKANLEIKVSKTAFGKDDSAAKELNFEYTVEGLKNKAVKVTLTPKAG